MANLPPRPESPPRGRDDRRLESDRYSARNTISPSRPRERVASRDRSYVPPRDFDTYRPPPFDNRRDDGFRRNEPVRRSDYDSRSDRDRHPWGRNERDRPRYSRPGADYDRDRRPYDMDRDYDRRRGSPRRRSRSPPRRRASPPPYYRDRCSRSPYRSSSPRKPLKLGNHLIAASPRPHSPYDRGTQRRSRYTPQSREGSPSPSRAAAAPVRSDSNSASISRPPESEQVRPKIEPSEISLGTKSQQPVEPISDSQSISHPPPPSGSHSHISQVASNATVERKDVKSEQLDGQPLEIKCESPRVIDELTAGSKRELSPSPLRQPRFMNNSTMRGGQPRRWPSRSPPRGPRINSKNANFHPPNSHPSSTHPSHTHPTTASHYPTGPRMGRRIYPPNTSTPPTKLSPQPAIKAASPLLLNEIKLPIIPSYEPKPSLIADLEQELTRLQAHRAHIASDCLQHEKGARRALHELDMATVDLRAAEGRRKIADMQLEKAKTGSLGIDGQPIEAPVV